MDKQQILKHCYVLGRWAGENNKERLSSKDSNFRQFYDAQVKRYDYTFRLDCIDQWYLGFDSVKDGATMR